MKILINIILLTICLNAVSQSVLTGKIIDKNNNPIEFANVRFSNSKDGAVSNELGEFELKYENNSNSIIVSHIAYDEKIIPIKHEKNITIILNDRIINLKEVTIRPDESIIIDIINALSKNYPISETNQTYQLINKVQTQDSLILDYFDGKINLITSTYVGTKKKVSANLLSTTKNYNHYNKLPSFYYVSPYGIISMLFPEKLHFIKDYKLYYFLNEGKLDENTGKLFFEPRKNNEFMYKGYLYYDIHNYAILFVHMDLIENEKNKGKLISIGFKKSVVNTKFVKEKYEIQYKKNEHNKYELDKLIYGSLSSFTSGNDQYNIDSKLNLVKLSTKIQNTKSIKFNLFTLKNSKYKEDKNSPYIDPIRAKIIKKMIEDENTTN